MNKSLFYKSSGLAVKNSMKIAFALAMSLLLGGCYFTAAVSDLNRPGGTTPWWCQGTPDLTIQECVLFSAQLDILEKAARQYPTLADFQAAGAVNITANTPPDTGEAYRIPGVDTATFNPNKPQALLYDGTTPGSQLVGVMWTIDGTVPAGFPGSRDVWVNTGPAQWALPAWSIRGYQNHPNVFAASHPCLASGVTLTSTTDACYIASHTEAFEILVANDDGVQAAGIDALVEGLYGLPNTVVQVVAPLANQSGSGSDTTPDPYIVSGSATTTLSGRPATAVHSTDPADLAGSGSPSDAVIFALRDQLLSPDVVLSGINEGQNYTNIGDKLSGTVGAARAGRRNGVSAIATSQGIISGELTDFPTGVTATLALLEDWRLGRTVNTETSVLNINIPTCLGALTPRGTLNTFVKPKLEPGDAYGVQDCASVEPIGNITNDLEAFNHGFIGITDMNRVDTLSVTSYNMGLALNFVPYTFERLVANETLLTTYESDVICFQEVWLPGAVNGVKQALGSEYPHIYIEPPEQVFTAGAACTLAEITPFADCALLQCPGLSGAALVACAPTACAAFLPTGACLDGVIGAVGIPDVTVQQVVDVVTQPAGIFAFDGSLGLILASKYPLKKREFQDFIDDSTGNHRGALYAEVELNNKKHVVGCTHPTANLAATIAYPASGSFNSWEEENLFMQTEMISFVNAKAGSNAILFGGDFNCSIENIPNAHDADFAPNCQVWLNDGFSDPSADQLPCTFCEADNLVLQPGGGTDAFFLDHIFVKNLIPAAPIVAERVFDDPVSISALNPVSELQVIDSPLLTHPSDHFGVRLDVVLP